MSRSNQDRPKRAGVDSSRDSNAPDTPAARPAPIGAFAAVSGQPRTLEEAPPGPTDQGIKIARAGAILGARSHSRRRTTMDAHGAQTAVLGVKAAPADQSGRLVETYGSVSVVAVLLGWRTIRLGVGDSM